MCHQLRKKKKFQLTQEAEAPLCVALQREEMTSKHLMPVPRRSRSSFYASGFHTQLKKPTGTSLFFCTNVIKSMAEKQRQAPSRGGGTWLVFTEFIYLSSVLFLFFFYCVFCDRFFYYYYFCLSVGLTVRAVVVHKNVFCTEERKTCSVFLLQIWTWLIKGSA